MSGNSNGKHNGVDIRSESPLETLGNAVIHHVPGPPQDLDWQGARLSGPYPLSLIIDGGALNMTVVSRRDVVDFGLIACRKTVPRMQRLLDYLEDALAQLEGTIEPPRGLRAGRSAARKGASTKDRAAR